MTLNMADFGMAALKTLQLLRNVITLARVIG